MNRTVKCVKLHKEAVGLESPPLPGELGQKIFQQISQEAWQLWLAQQLMFINENRLNLVDPKARAFLMAEMQKFLFEDSDTKPAGYTPPAETNTTNKA